MAEKTIMLGRRITNSSKRSTRHPTSRFALPTLGKKGMAAKLAKFTTELGPVPVSRKAAGLTRKQWVNSGMQEYVALHKTYVTRYGK